MCTPPSGDPPAPSPLRGKGAGPSAAPSLCLASGSPRRRQLLHALGFAFAQQAPEMAEVWEGPTAAAAARALARTKLAWVRARRPRARLGHEVLLAADTVVLLAGEPQGKPPSAAAHEATLAALSGRTQEVMTGLAVGLGRRLLTRAVVSRVTFRRLSRATIAAYVASGEGADKAGGWALQGAGVALVARLEGCPSNVVGLPAVATLALLARLGLVPP